MECLRTIVVTRTSSVILDIFNRGSRVFVSSLSVKTLDSDY